MLQFPNKNNCPFYAINESLIVFNNMENNKPENRIDAFFKTEYKKLVNFVHKNMEQRYADASPEDIVQDVALNLLDKLNIDVQIENLAAYIYRSLRNKIFDTQKRKRNTFSMDAFNNQKNGNEITNIPLYENDENTNASRFEPDQLRAAIEELSDDDKYIINETHFEGKTYEQLSKELNTPVGTLLSRKHRAQVKLGKILEANRLN
jgi:RNA polymerase sigma factor (sigma-70 family)